MNLDPTIVTPERAHQCLLDYQEQGVFEVVLPSEPLGETWVIADWEGHLFKVEGVKEVQVLIAGLGIMTRFLAEKAGLQI